MRHQSSTIAPRYDKPSGRPRKRGIAEYLMYGFAAVLLALGGIAAYAYLAPGMKEVPNKIAQGYEDDRINLLLIGVGGDTHPGEGKDLADSIILVSLQPSTRRVALISLPRDLYIEMDHGVGMQRLNAAHAIGAQIGFRGRGAGFLAHTVERVIGQPVHGYARIDFLAFEKVIDAIGGVDIYVHRPFYDYLFKDGFQQGLQHMNGKRALQFARYRYILDFEGNTFGREMRQQQVISAVREKLKDLDARQVLSLARLALSSSEYTATNLTTPQMLELYTTFRGTKPEDVRHVSLKKYTKIIKLTDPRVAGDAVAPKNGDLTPIRQVVQTVFNGRGPIVAPGEIELTDVAPEAPRTAQPVVLQTPRPAAAAATR